MPKITFVSYKSPIIMAALAALAVGCASRSGSRNPSSSALDPGGVRSNYRLLLVNTRGPGASLDEDILAPQSAAQVARTKVANAALSSVYHGMIPLLGNLAGQGFNDGKDLDVTGTLLTTATAIRKEFTQRITGELKNVLLDPIDQDYWLVPWSSPQDDNNFYNHMKMSVTGGEMVNIFGISGRSPKFDGKMTNDLVALQKRLYKESPDPVFFLGAKTKFYIETSRSRFHLSALVGLKPQEKIPFVKTSPQLDFDSIVIPDSPETGIVALIELEVELHEGAKDPIMTVTFGQFDKAEGGYFRMKGVKPHLYAPRLEGTPKAENAAVNKLASGVRLGFSFRELDINLRTLQVEQNQVLLTPGLKAFGGKIRGGGFLIGKVNETFKTEINNAIDSEIKGALDKANQDKLGGGIDSATLQQFFNTVLKRGEA